MALVGTCTPLFTLGPLTLTMCELLTFISICPARLCPSVTAGETPLTPLVLLKPPSYELLQVH